MPELKCGNCYRSRRGKGLASKRAGKCVAGARCVEAAPLAGWGNSGHGAVCEPGEEVRVAFGTSNGEDQKLRTSFFDEFPENIRRQRRPQGAEGIATYRRNAFAVSDLVDELIYRWRIIECNLPRGYPHPLSGLQEQVFPLMPAGLGDQ
jgi:hypothetical protein